MTLDKDIDPPDDAVLDALALEVAQDASLVGMVALPAFAGRMEQALQARYYMSECQALATIATRGGDAWLLDVLNQL